MTWNYPRDLSVIKTDTVKLKTDPPEPDRLCGGARLESDLGKRWTFTVTLPLDYRNPEPPW